MERFLTAYYPTVHGDIKKVQLFGYASNSIPGVEIVGLGKGSRALREKIIFFTRRLKLKLPVKRFILCIEEEQIPMGDHSYLEFPFFFLLLNLAEIIQMGMLESCLCSGRLQLDGKILLPNSSIFIDSKLQGESTLLLSSDDSTVHIGKRIFIEDLFRDRGLSIAINIIEELSDKHG